MNQNLIAQLDLNKIKGELPLSRPGALVARQDLSLGVIVSELLPYLYALAGLALFIYLLLGGFQLLTSGGDPKGIEDGKKKITNAVIGFIIVFAAYFLMQALETILGIKVL